MKTLAKQFKEIEYYIPINPLAILKAAEFIKENSVICSEGIIGLWAWNTVMFKDGSIIGKSPLTKGQRSLLTIFNG